MTLDNRPEVIHKWVKGLRQRYGGRRIAVGIEQKRGPLIYILCKYDFLVIYPINSSTVAKYRQAFTPSRAKDDPRDANLLVELLRKHRDKLRVWEPSSVEFRKLTQLVESRRCLVEEKVRLTNRITASPKNYYPQVLEWFEDKDTQVFCAFVERYPRLEAAQAASDDDLKLFFKPHHVVRETTISRRLKQIQTGQVLTTDEGVVEPMQLLVSAWIQQLKVLLPNIRVFEQQIETLFEAQADAELFAKLPGATPFSPPFIGGLWRRSQSL